MENLLIKGTSRTPEIALNKDGNLRIKGRSIPEDPGFFYKPAQSWIATYLLTPCANTVLQIELEYMNSGSAKSILEILLTICELAQNGHSLSIAWLYETGDEDMLEKGEYFESIVKHKFTFLETD
jgi:hypothetical protein